MGLLLGPGGCLLASGRRPIWSLCFQLLSKGKGQGHNLAPHRPPAGRQRNRTLVCCVVRTTQRASVSSELGIPQPPECGRVRKLLTKKRPGNNSTVASDLEDHLRVTPSREVIQTSPALPTPTPTKDHRVRLADVFSTAAFERQHQNPPECGTSAGHRGRIRGDMGD